MAATCWTSFAACSAFALWDERRGRLLLARDPFGIKPLYIADDGRTLRFASQVKALLATGEIEASPDLARETGFFLWGHIPEPFTLYKEIRALPPGTSLSINTEGVKRVHQYFSLPRRMEALEPLTSAKSSDEARAVLSDASQVGPISFDLGCRRWRVSLVGARAALYSRSRQRRRRSRLSP